MKLFRSLAVAFAALYLAAIGFAAADPSGAWKWSLNRPDGEPIEVSLKLELKEGKLTGTYKSPFGEAPISKTSVKDDVIAFEVEREFNGNKFTVKYGGKLEGDAIKGTVEFPGFDGGEPRKMEWNAKRVK